MPSYVELLKSGDLRRRVSVLDDRLGRCDICPWQCGVDRRAGETRVCQGGYLPQVSSWAPHFGEEPALSGTHLGKGQARGTGNVFLGHCNMRCVYCQNWQISQPRSLTVAARKQTEPRASASGLSANLAATSGSSPEQRPGMEFERLASILLELQAAGCHNIGFVSPTHFVPQIVRSVEQAASAGLHLPLIYNTNAYDDVGVLRLLEGIFDIYLPDLRYSEDAVALEYSRVPGYVGHSRAALAEMYRQVGDDLLTDERGLVQRGLIIRLLILPNDLGGLRETLEWIRDTLSPRVTLSVMSQYYPSGRVTEERFPLLARRIHPSEYEKVVGWIDSFGFENGWIQPFEAQAAEYYRPDFADPSQPFADARDFSD